MNDCCLKVIAKYEEIGMVREGAALFCKDCKNRLRLINDVWGTEEP